MDELLSSVNSSESVVCFSRLRAWVKVAAVLRFPEGERGLELA